MASDLLLSGPSDVKTYPYVVCIGASAGGLQAIESFFTASTEASDPDLAFVLVMHMAADHDSIMVELLARYTSLRVQEISAGMKLEENCIYFVPGNLEVTLESGTFQVKGARSKAPIDFLMKALATELGPRTIAVIMSGAASDGSVGIQHIKAQGGLVIVQAPDSAQQTGMPDSAIKTRVADLILSPPQMQRHIAKWVHRVEPKASALESSSRQEPYADLQRIFYLLKSTSGHDFTLYKKNTIKRRLERRMVVQGIETVPDYIRFLEHDIGERANLLREILIGVTSFFRDASAFDTLRDLVVPHIAKNARDRSLRIWVPGCSTGQEAYSIAMVLLEELEKIDELRGRGPGDIKIFASDIDKEAIEFAREGLYPHSIVEEISPERLNRFFTLDGSGYQIKKEVKDRLIFAHHNVTRDPPFSKLDLISCRNLMIYMEPILQQKILRIFHYSLNPHGILFMGSSETAGDASPMFGVFDKKWKFFERKSVVVQSNRRIEFETFRDISALAADPPVSSPAMPRKMAIREISQDALLNQFVPPTVVCSELGEILFIHGRTGRYLEPPTGEARLNLFSMAREEIKLEVSRGFQKVLANNEDVRFADLRIRREGEIVGLDITMRLLNRSIYPGRLVIITFEESSVEPISPENAILLDRSETDQRNIEIERELLFTREHMQTLVEQLETSNEELKSMNEELQSSNEELQSSNEELETAKEELQAVNEELVTLNAELQEKIEELSTANSDLDNFLSSSSIATIFLDRRFYITRFSRSTGKIFHLIPSDIGRSLGDIASQVKYDAILSDATEVLEHLVSVEKMVELKDGRWLSMRISPYKTAGNVIDGVVIAFSDVSQQRLLEDLVQIYQEASESLGVALMIFDSQANIVYASTLMHRELGYEAGLLSGLNLNKLGFHSEGYDLTRDLVRDWSGPIEFRLNSSFSVPRNGRIVSAGESKRMRCLIVFPQS